MMLARVNSTSPLQNHKARARPASRPAARRQHQQLDLFGAAPRTTPRPFDPKKLTQLALGVWHASVPVRGTIAEHCFTSRRLALPDPAVARFHPSLKFNDVRAPGIVFLLRDTKTREPTGVMRVYLAADGSKVIGKRVLGPAVGTSINREPRPP